MALDINGDDGVFKSFADFAQQRARSPLEKSTARVAAFAPGTPTVPDVRFPQTLL